MAAGDTDVGTGTLVTYGGFTMELLNVAHNGISRGSVQTSHMGTTVSHTYMPTDLYDPGQIVLEVHFKTTEAPPITAPASTLTVTFPDSETWLAPAFLQDFEYTDPLEEKMTATATFKVSDAITF